MVQKNEKFIKNDFILRMAASSGLPGGRHLSKADVTRFVDAVFVQICSELITKGELRVTNFGKFSVVTRKPHPAYDFANKKQMLIPEQKIIKWKQTKTLSRFVNDGIYPPQGFSCRVLTVELCKTLPWERETIDFLVRLFFRVLAEHLSGFSAASKVELRGFGVFRISRYKPKTVISPSDGKEYTSEERMVVRFKASKHLNKLVA